MRVLTPVCFVIKAAAEKGDVGPRFIVPVLPEDYENLIRKARALNCSYRHIHYWVDPMYEEKELCSIKWPY